MAMRWKGSSMIGRGTRGARHFLHAWLSLLAFHTHPAVFSHFSQQSWPVDSLSDGFPCESNQPTALAQAKHDETKNGEWMYVCSFVEKFFLFIDSISNHHYHLRLFLIFSGVYVWGRNFGMIFVLESRAILLNLHLDIFAGESEDVKEEEEKERYFISTVMIVILEK